MINEPKKRGRPPAYDPELALAGARDVFWDSGYAASSLDELSAAMAMNRPSVYGAFGDKEALYLKTLERYRDDSLAALRAALDPARTLQDGLAAVYAKSIEIYLGGLNAARGCFLIGTATAEAVSRAAVRDILRGSLQAFDGAIAHRLKLAMERGELRPQADPSALALAASAIMHSLAVRARAGESRQELEALARAGVALICPSPRAGSGT